ncbi:MAG: flagellar export protein FliJ [bacterium]|nr:flagellar export protein FliJ [bacterium]MCP5067347.1 flagellar export protein FliJ [bacterium]
MRRGFRLGSVLRVRSHELDQAAFQLVQAERAEARAVQRVDEIRARAHRARDILRDRLQGGLDSGELRIAADGIAQLGDEVLEATAEIATAREQVAVCRDAVLKARQRVKALERMRALHHQREQRERARREQRQLDEAGLRRFGTRPLASWLVFIVFAATWVVPFEAVAQQDGEPAKVQSEYGVTTLLTEIRTRQVELDRRDAELAEREQAVVELEQAIAEQLVELEKIASTVEERIAAWEADNGDSVRKLAKIYSALQPARAASLLEELDVSLATQIVAKMKDKQSAAVLARISVTRALDMSRRVAHPLAMEPAKPSTQ